MKKRNSLLKSLYPVRDFNLRNIDPTLQAVHDLLLEPPDVTSVKLLCSCGISYKPPWNKPLENELAPIRNDSGNLHFIPSGVGIPCPECGTPNILNFPKTERKGVFHLYGDEAVYDPQNGNISPLYVYAFVHVSGEAKPQFQTFIEEAKRKILIDQDPSNWVLHTYEVRSPEWRKKHGCKLKTAQVNYVLRVMAKKIGGIKEEHFFPAVSIIPPLHGSLSVPGRGVEFARDLALYHSILTITNALTLVRICPRYFIEAQTIDHRNNFIDYYVEKIGRSLHKSLLFHWACRQQHVGIPCTIPKQPIPQLEFSDLLAFSIRRFLVRRECGKKSEIPVNLFGKIFWGMLTPRHYLTEHQQGFPDQEFFAQDAWQ